MMPMPNKLPKFFDNHKICIICEGNEEYEYLNRLKNLKVWNEQYDISLVNAGGNGNIPARYQDRYQNGADELVLVFCDTEKKPHEQYEDIKRKPEGSTPVYRITYEECVQMVGQMKDSFETDVFGVEKEDGKVQGIIAAVYQSVFGQDAYPSLEEKAANLLYFMIKDHPYADGCKRIAASLFLEFLDKNNALFLDGEKRLSDGTLVAITLMIAESKPEEKEVMVKLVMNLLKL